MASARVMRAIRISEFGGPEVLKYVTDALVPTPKPNEVLVRVRATGINPVETYLRAGQYSSLPSLPFTPGSDVAGTVDEVGSAVSRFKKGDRVYTIRTTSGSYAEYATAEECLTFPLPDRLSFQQGAACGVPYFTAYKALYMRARAQPNETVLVHGASGGVGIAACQLARNLGCRVIGTAGTEAGLEAARQSGAHLTVNHRDKGYLDQIQAYTDGKGVDVILEMLTNVNLANDLQILSKNGRVIIVGSRGPTEMNPRATMLKDSDIRGMLLFNSQPTPASMDKASKMLHQIIGGRGPIEINPRNTMGKEIEIRGMALFASDVSEFETMGAFLTAGFEAGWLTPVVGHEFPLREAAQAQIEVIEHSAGTRGKIVLTVD